MKLSDYIVSFLEKEDVKDVFLLSGGGIMHIVDSLVQNKAINRYHNLHEQASGFCADGYSLYSGKPGVCIVTTGPGATNTVTALASSFIDSTPVIYISGQVRTDTISTIPGVRQTGAQEVDIVSIVKPVTKYAVTVMDAEDVKYHLEKAFFISQHERPGPVWLDIPLDIQAKLIDPKILKGFDPVAEGYEKPLKLQQSDEDIIISLFNNSKRPVLMIGSGVKLAHAEDQLIQFVIKWEIPVISSRRVRGILKNEDEKYYFGCVGALADRYANYILQNSDFMLSIGSGLRYYLTAYNESNFAKNAKRVVVNVDSAELEKLNMPDTVKIKCDAKCFLNALLSNNNVTNNERLEWWEYCNSMKQKYLAVNEYIAPDNSSVNPYKVAQYIGQYMGDNDVLVTSPSAFAYAFSIPRIYKEQKTINHIGLGSMGTALPEAIGACVAAGSRTIVCEGDGGLQHNIQELALLKQYNLPVIVFVDSNQGYRQIHTMQETHFNSRYAGCTKESGISFPNFELLAQAYGLKYIKIDSAKDAEKCVKKALIDNEPKIVEMITTMDVEYLPIMKSKMGANGVMETPSLELLFPFLPDDEHRENMKISEGK
ncbi:MAG: thiamine pyrophosphate-binding protein [Oscillospiraceae bacterium]|nr:thiamine pyrophosphate-binding protein [Oscillospiraceae bacterium]